MFSAIAVGQAGFQWLRDSFGWYNIQSPDATPTGYDLFIIAVTDYTTALVFYLLILLVVIVWDFTRGTSRKLLIGVYVSLIVLSAAITLTYYPPG